MIGKSFSVTEGEHVYNTKQILLLNTRLHHLSAREGRFSSFRRQVSPLQQEVNIFLNLILAAADVCDRRYHTTRQQAEQYYNRHGLPLSLLKIGNYVRLQDSATKRLDRVGTVVGVGRRSDYHIKLPSGRVY